MLNRNQEKQPQDKTIQAFLEAGCEFEGSLVFTGTVRINGKLQGDIRSESLLIIGEAACIRGNIQVGSIVVGGLVEGEVVATERVEIQKNGVFKGKIKAPILVTHEGAQLEAEIQIQGHSKAKNEKVSH